jgi:TetR/AcrR family transcriptional regulator
MPRTKEQNAEIRQQRKETILRAALSVYVEKGYSASEIIDVAERAGVGKGLVHYYYKNKANLYRELFTVMMDRSKEYMESIFYQQEPVLSLFEQYIRTMYQGVLENRERILFFLRMPHDLKMVFSEEEIKEFKWPHFTMQILSEVISRGMQTGEIRSMSPRLLAVQLSGALFHGLTYFIRGMDDKEKNTVGSTADSPAKSLADLPDTNTFMQDIKNATETCMTILHPGWRWTHD